MRTRLLLLSALIPVLLSAVACREAVWRAQERAQYFQIKKQLETAVGTERWDGLAIGLELAYRVGDSRLAREWSEEALRVAERDLSENLKNDLLHSANTVLGLVALEAGNTGLAGEHLIASAEGVGFSPVLASFGPDMTLARRLFLEGDQRTVTEYLDLCRHFWSAGNELLDRWVADIEAGREPDFWLSLVLERDPDAGMDAGWGREPPPGSW